MQRYENPVMPVVIMNESTKGDFYFLYLNYLHSTRKEISQLI